MSDIEIVFGHPTIPADTPGLPEVDSDRVPAAGLSPQLRAVLAEAVQTNIAFNEAPQTAGGPDDVVALTVHTLTDAVSMSSYAAAEVEATDTDGTTWGYTFTVV